MAFASPVHASLSASQMAKPLRIGADDVANYRDLERLGIYLGDSNVREMASIFGGDAIQGLNVTSANIGAPVQFLQSWLPGMVADITAARKIDDAVGMMVAGAWEDEEIVQAILERTGAAVSYSDSGNVPLANFVNNFERRSIVRFELGMQVEALEEARSARIRVNSADAKRKAVMRALEIRRNRVGFLGFNSGNNRTYGLLNDPNLPSYESISHAWSTGTFQDIKSSILAMLSKLRTQSQDNIDPANTPLTMLVATNSVDRLNETTDFGISVMSWLKANYPKLTVKSAPELNLANSGANVVYLYADNIQDDASTDGGQVLLQVVPAKFKVLGVQKTAKGYLEDNSNATAGVMCKRPYGLVRYSGI